MQNANSSGTASELEQVSATLQAICHRLVETTQHVQHDPIIKIAQPVDIPRLKDLSQLGTPHPLVSTIEDAFDIFQYRTRVNHPRFMGLIPSPTSPIAWLGDVIASAFNALGASKLQASGPVLVEKQLVAWFARQLGFDPDVAGGICVSGGSMANQMGIILARDHQPSFTDMREISKGVMYVSDQTHYSVTKAARLLGFGKSNIRILPTEGNNFKMVPRKLKEAIQKDRQAGLVPFLVVGTCGTTNTGAVDPLRQLADICREESMWLHVDGAYGASAALSKSYKHTVEGLQHADSVSWDAHKWLFQTYECGMLLVREKASLLKSFINEGDYLRDGVAMEDEEIPNFWNYTMELTRPASRAMKLWFTIRVLGVDAIGEMLDHGFRLAEAAERVLLSKPDWEIVSSASLGILAFSLAPKDKTDKEIEVLNTKISQQLVETNTVGILTTKIKGRVVLRLCALSPQLSPEEMAGICHKIDATAQLLL